MKSQKGFTLIELLTLVWVPIFLVGVYGWILNIGKIADSDFAAVTGMLILRVIGIFVAPLGAVLGFL